jgi:hypothetical protein
VGKEEEMIEVAVTPLNIEMHKALLFYANRKNWNPVASYADGYWYIAGRPWLMALAALKNAGLEVDLTAPSDIVDPLEAGEDLSAENERLLLRSEGDFATITALRDDLARAHAEIAALKAAQ